MAPGGSEQQLALRKPAPAKEQSGAAGEPFASILAEIRGLKEAVGRLAPTAPVAASGVGLTSGDAPLEGAVDSLRRLLSELIEERTELLVRDLVKVRQEAAALPGEARAGIVEQLDRILESLGAARFEAEPMELVDPLIHSVAEERWQEGAPEGVIIETVRPGYRTARRLVVWKAAVAVNRRA